MPLDLAIVGDSHTGALQDAALALGLSSRVLCLSGNVWHEGSLRHDPQVGLFAPRRPALNRLIREVAEQMGGSVFPREVPVIASIGYHLGRLVPLFARHGHTPDAAEFGADPGRLFASSAVTEAFLAHHRQGLWRLLRLAAQECRLVVVAPPILAGDRASLRTGAMVTDRLLALGLTVFDPRREADWPEDGFPEDWRAPDGRHGNTRYGEEVLRRLAAKGHIRLPG